MGHLAQAIRREQMRNLAALCFVLFWLPTAALAQVIALAPNQSANVRFDSVRLLEQGTPPANFPGVAAHGEFLLDATGTRLTIRMENVSTATANAVLYALDLGLPLRLVRQEKLEATFSEFPEGATWLGPTDAAAPTAGLGFSTFAARPAMLQRLDDFLTTTTNLPAGFLRPGQRGTITLSLTYLTGTREPVLRIEPRLYFLAPDPRTPQTNRVPLVINGTAQPK
jgi:hypothetical protein